MATKMLRYQARPCDHLLAIKTSFEEAVVVTEIGLKPASPRQFAFLEKVVQLRLQMLSQPAEMLPGQNQGLIDNAESQKVQKSTD